MYWYGYHVEAMRYIKDANQVEAMRYIKDTNQLMKQTHTHYGRSLNYKSEEFQ